MARLCKFLLKEYSTSFELRILFRNLPKGAELMHSLVFILVTLFLQDVPLKPKEEFEIKLDYQFRQRPQPDHNTVQLGNTRSDYERRSGSSVLPYLMLEITMLKLPVQKMRVQVTSNTNERAMNRKVSVGTPFELDLGFTDDMKDRVTAYQYTLTLLSDDRKPVETITLAIDEDGSFFVNGEKRGKF